MFPTLTGNGRIWIYVANRPLTSAESSIIEERLSVFCKNWAAHGTSLEASFLIKYNRFIIFAVNQAVQNATGCSIDASVHFIQQLEQEFQIELLDKMNVTYYNGEFIAHKSLIDFKKMAKAKSISKNTIVFNNLVNTKIDYLENWEVPAKDSWHARFLA